MKKLFLPTLLTFVALSSVIAQNAALPPRVGETWRLDIEGLAPATLKFTAPSNALPGAVDGTSDMAGFTGKSRAAVNQGSQLFLWQGKEGTYYCVFTGNPTVQGATVSGGGAALERAGQQPEDLNKKCSATLTAGGAGASSGSSTAAPAATAKPDAALPVPAPAAPPQKLEVGQHWRVSLAVNGSTLNTDAYNLKLLKPAASVPSNLGAPAGWFEASVDEIQRVSVFSLTPAPTADAKPKGFVKLEGGVLLAVVDKGSVGFFACGVKLQQNRFTGGEVQLKPAVPGATCNAMFAGGNALPADAAAVLENAKRASGSAAAWAGLKSVAYRTESNAGGVLRQTVTVVDFAGKRLYREFLQGSGSQQVVTAKEWQVPAAGGKAKGTYRLEAGSGGGVVFQGADTPELDRVLNTDFWALRHGNAGWDNATVEALPDGSQLLTAGRGGFYTRYIIKGGRYNGFQTAFSLQILTVNPESLGDAGGILAPAGTWKVTASQGQFDAAGAEKIVRVVVNFAFPADLFDMK